MVPASSQRVTNPPMTQLQYEVTESNDVPAASSNDNKEYVVVQQQQQHHHQQQQEPPTSFDVVQLTRQQQQQISGNDLQTNEIFLGQSSMNPMPMQTNLHSSLHFGFEQSPSGQDPGAELHVGHPAAAAGPPQPPLQPQLSATQFYDLLNTFSPQMPNQYSPGKRKKLINKSYCWN